MVGFTCQSKYTYILVATSPLMIRKLKFSQRSEFHTCTVALFRPILKLRDYQEDAISAVHNAIRRDVRRPSVVLATGGGKTVVFSHLIPQLKPLDPAQGNKTLVLAHKQEIVQQAYEKILAMNPDLKVDIDMQKLIPSPDADIIVASVPTLSRSTRLNQYRPEEFKTIILDECHHAVATTWVKILKYFGADHVKLPIQVIGFTATMERADGEALGKIFDEIVYERSLLDMIKNGELCDAKYSTVDVGIDFLKVRSNNGDFVEKRLSEVMNTNDVNSVVTAAYLKLRQQYGFKSTLVFCVDVDHCKSLCSVLHSQGVNAQYVLGSTHGNDRRQILDDFKKGKIDVLCNVLVFTEGTDIPNIDSIVLARPTKSRSLLVQMIGRGLRLYEGKTHCHFVDLADSKAVGIQSCATLFGTQDPVPKRKFKDSASGQEVDERLLGKQQLKELERHKKEEALKAKLSDIESRKELMNLTFETIEGFAALAINDATKVITDENVNGQFSSSKLKWIRLEYDLWGLPMSYSDKFLTIERKDGKFILRLNTFTSTGVKFASDFKCANFRVLAEITIEPQLGPILIRAESLSYQYSSTNNNTAFKSKRVAAGKATAKQINYIKPKLSKKAKLMYKDWDSSNDKKLENEINQFSIYRVSDLIFAIKYSVNSLWVRWELQKIFGYNDKDKRVIEKFAKNPNSEMQTQLTAPLPTPIPSPVASPPYI